MTPLATSLGVIVAVGESPHVEFTPRAMAVLAVAAVLLAVLGLVWWRIDVEINPIRPCPRCNGSGRGRFSRPGAYNVCKHGRERPRAFAKGAAARHNRRRSS